MSLRGGALELVTEEPVCIVPQQAIVIKSLKAHLAHLDLKKLLPARYNPDTGVLKLTKINPD